MQSSGEEQRRGSGLELSIPEGGLNENEKTIRFGSNLCLAVPVDRQNQHD